MIALTAYGLGLIIGLSLALVVMWRHREREAPETALFGDATVVTIGDTIYKIGELTADRTITLPGLKDDH